MPPCERSGASRPDRSCLLAEVPITVKRSDTQTMSPMRSAGSSKRLAASSRVSTASMPLCAFSFATTPATSLPDGR